MKKESRNNGICMNVAVAASNSSSMANLFSVRTISSMENYVAAIHFAMEIH